MSAKVANKPNPQPLSQWHIVLHNDLSNTPDKVATAIVLILHLEPKIAQEKTAEAHNVGKAVIFTTHKERAELILEQFSAKKITVTAEKAE